MQKEDPCKSGVNVLAPVNERYPAPVDYCSYRLIHKSQRCDEDVTSETQKMCKQVTVQLKDQAFIRNDSIPVTNFFAEFKPACGFLRIQEGVAVWLSRECINDPAPATISVQVTMSSSDANRHEGTITSYERVVSNGLMIGRCA